MIKFRGLDLGFALIFRRGLTAHHFLGLFMEATDS